MSERERLLNSFVTQVFDFMRKQRVTLAVLDQVGGEDLDSSDFRKVERARRVERTWSLMAGLGVAFADLERAEPSRRPRGGGVFSEIIENKGLFDHGPRKAKSLKNKEKAVHHSVEPSDPDPGPTGRWKHKRRLIAEGAAP
jgi:hypothetical protein